MDIQTKYNLLMLVVTGEKFDAMDLSRAYYKAYGTSCDWHDCSDYLDYLERRGIVEHAGWGYHRNHCYQLITK